MRTEAKTETFSPQDLMVLGLDEIAYVRSVVENGQRMFAVHAADGTRLGILPTRETALGAIVQNDLELVALH